jgi:hypothetical protein
MELDRPRSFHPTGSDEAPVSRTYLRTSAHGYYGEPGIDPSRIRALLKRRFWTILLGFISVMAAV